MLIERNNNQTLTKRPRRLSLLIVVFAVLLWMISFVSANRFKAFSIEPTPAQDYSRFSHSSANHKTLGCSKCHQRTDNSATPKFPGHSACTDCHLAQFTTPNIPMCGICHSNVQSVPPPMRSFPARFNEKFNAKFDHAAHDKGAGRPENGCAACHTQMRGGDALSIPVGLSAHNSCFSCHTANIKIGGCNTCHVLAPYSRTPMTAKAFQANFSHAEHGPRQKLSCSDCHTVKAGMPQKRQVTSSSTAQHLVAERTMSCRTCHNDKQAFGDNDFGNCKKCHTGTTFQMPR